MGLTRRQIIIVNKMKGEILERNFQDQKGVGKTSLQREKRKKCVAH